MENEREEEERLRSVALQNASAIFLARQRAERDLLAAKEALEEKTQELASSLALVKATLESTTDAIAVTDARGEVTDFNHKLIEMWGVSGEQVISGGLRQFAELTSRLVENTDLVRARLQEICAASPPESYDLLELTDGRIIERFSKPQRVAEREVGRVWSFRDITERKRVERALEHSYQSEQQARAAAERANEAKDEFISALSHELRTPLTPVLAILATIHQDAGIPEALAEDLATVWRNVELEARLIDDLLDLTRITRGKLHLQYEPVSASRVIEDAIGVCQPDFRARSLELRRDFAEPSPSLLVDGARITQILWNLLKNAAKFTPNGGTITVRSRITEGRDGQEMIIEVRDTGIGMEPGIIARVFNVFEQGDRNISRQFGGLGLGLAISKAIAEAHGGNLRGMSRGRGCGSTFILTLPCIAAGRASDEILAPIPSSGALLTAAPGHRPLRILLVEDHVDTAAILSRLLRRMGHDVIPVNSIAAALATAEREMDEAGIDLLISDLGLPDGSGRDLMRMLSGRHHLKGIALSGFGRESDVEQSAAAGFSRHLTKPIDVAILKATIQELMHL